MIQCKMSLNDQCVVPNEENLHDSINTYDMLRFIFDGSVNEKATEQQNRADESYSYNMFPDNCKQYSSKQNYPIQNKSIETNDLLQDGQDKGEMTEDFHFHESRFGSDRFDASYMFREEEYCVSTVEQNNSTSTQGYLINDGSINTNDMFQNGQDNGNMKEDFHFHESRFGSDRFDASYMFREEEYCVSTVEQNNSTSTQGYLINDGSINTNDMLQNGQDNGNTKEDFHFHESRFGVRKGSCDNSQMSVETSGNPGKRLCCMYCHKRYSKLSRHLESVHKDEAEVKKFVALPKSSKERREIQDSLRKRGSFVWNTSTAINNGELCTSRRPNRKILKNATDFKSCPKCFGTYAVTGFGLHFLKCTNGVFKGERSLLVLSRSVEGRVHVDANDRLAREVFPGMQEDDIVRIIRYDWLIIIYGNDLSTRYTAVSQLGMIRNKIRMAGRLFCAIKSDCPFVTDFASTFRPKCFNSMLSAIKSVGKFNTSSNEYGSCSPVLAAVTEVRKIGRMLVAELMKLENESLEQQKHAEAFVTLMESQETNTMLKTVHNTQNTRKRVKKHNIPSTEDIRRLATYIDSERVKYFNELSDEYSFSVWVKLLETMAASIIVFNRKRTGETRYILVSEFMARQSIDKDSQLPLYSALSEQDKKVARKYSQMKIRGKLGATVPVLLTHNMEKSIELLLKHREDAGVNNNEFLFGLPSIIGKIRVVNTCNVLRDFSKKCGADNPESLRGTNLRKHMASYCVTMDLDDAGIGEVAKHMGHSEMVHRNVYRHSTLDRDIVRMSKRLQAAQGMRDRKSVV